MLLNEPDCELTPPLTIQRKTIINFLYITNKVKATPEEKIRKKACVTFEEFSMQLFHILEFWNRQLGVCHRVNQNLFLKALGVNKSF